MLLTNGDAYKIKEFNRTMNISIQELDKYIALTHEEVQYISQKTHSITNANIIGWNKIPLFRESHGIRKCGQNVEFIISKQVVHISTCLKLSLIHVYCCF